MAAWGARSGWSAVAVTAAVTAFAACSSGDGGEKIAPEGAPYSFEVPDGFKKGQATGGAGARFPSGVGLDDTSVVLVSAFDAGDVNAGNIARLSRSIDRDFRRVTERNARSVTGPKQTKVAGHPALMWRMRGFRSERGELTDGEVYSVFAPSTALNVTCRWKAEKRAELVEGCESVRSTLELR